MHIYYIQSVLLCVREVLLLNTFSGGVHTPHNKELTENIEITRQAPPEKLRVPLSQHIGAPPELKVCEGDTLKKGQLIAEFNGNVSANIFSPVSGKVLSIEKGLYIIGQMGTHIVIENDGKEDEVRLDGLKNPTPQQIRDRIREAGIVGMGGAAFPTPVKLSLPKDKKCEALIINAAECEPYITCDYRIMLEYTDEFISGVKLLAKALKTERIVIALEDNKRAAYEKLVNYPGIEIKMLKTKYPQGSEKQLIYAAIEKKVPLGGLPIDAGAVVQNVHTAFSVSRAADLGIPCYERVITVSGRAIRDPKNMWVKTGTTIEQIMNDCGGAENAVKILNGGPMMGVAQAKLNVPVSKATSALLFLTKEEVDLSQAMTCINCGRCVRYCPMKIMPVYIDAYTLTGDLASAKKYGALNCIECGCCSYVCPSKRPLVQSIRLSKKLIKDRNI